MPQRKAWAGVLRRPVAPAVEVSPGPTKPAPVARAPPTPLVGRPGKGGKGRLWREERASLSPDHPRGPRPAAPLPHPSRCARPPDPRADVTVRHTPCQRVRVDHWGGGQVVVVHGSGRAEVAAQRGGTFRTRSRRRKEPPSRPGHGMRVSTEHGATSRLTSGVQTDRACEGMATAPSQLGSSLSPVVHRPGGRGKATDPVRGTSGAPATRRGARHRGCPRRPGPRAASHRPPRASGCVCLREGGRGSTHRMIRRGGPAAQRG